MDEIAREFARVRGPVLLLGAVAWVLLITAPAGVALHCAAMGSGSGRASLQMLLSMNPPVTLAAGWALMLIAMMAPVLIPPISHVRRRSFASRRWRGVALFVTGYFGVWMAVGIILTAAGMAIGLALPASYLPATTLLAIAVIWQCSPFKQRCLNRCHAHRELAAFGFAADADALRFGFEQGIWCAASCWAVMLLPMLLPQGHLPAMAAVTVLIIGERIEQPMRPDWRWRGLGTLTRFLRAQARIRLGALGHTSYSRYPEEAIPIPRIALVTPTIGNSFDREMK